MGLHTGRVSRATPPSLLTGRFLLTTAAALAYFTALGTVTPALSGYTKGTLGGQGWQIGVVIGAFAVSAAVIRPWAGRLGDVRGRRLLIVGGAGIFAVSVAAYGLIESIPWLIAMRLVSGIGEAGVFIGAATTAQDLAPAERRGEAASYFSVAIYGGLGLGPQIGERLADGPGIGAVFATSAALSAISVVLALGVPRWVDTSGRSVDARPVLPDPDGPRPRLLHPAAIGPGIVLLMATAGLAALQGFLPLVAADTDMSYGSLFLLNSIVVLVVRIGLARLPDRLGVLRGTGSALVLQALGFGVLFAWAQPAGLVLGMVTLALGGSLMYPALIPEVMRNAPDSERSQAVGTFSLFFDSAQGLGGFLFGAVASVTGSDRSTFAVAGLLCLIGLVILIRGPVGRAARARRDLPAVATPAVPDCGA